MGIIGKVLRKWFQCLKCCNDDHVQNAQNITTCFELTKVQNILFYFTVLLLYIWYFNVIHYLFRLWYMVCRGTPYKHQ